MTAGAAPVERSDAAEALRVFAVDPFGIGGIALRGRASASRERWLACLSDLLPSGAPLRRLPLHAGDSRLFGGLDLAATLAVGRPVLERGILTETDGGVLLVPMAERMTAGMAVRLGSVLDHGEAVLERDGLRDRSQARVGLVALDEGLDADEVPPAALIERLGLWVALDAFDPGREVTDRAATVSRARALYPSVTIDDAALEALCETALALGVGSLRASLIAVKVARAAAALDGRRNAANEDAALAARLVLAPRATRLPAEPAPPDSDDSLAPPPAEAAPRETDGEHADRSPEDIPADLVLAAARAAIPPDVLARLDAGLMPRQGRPAPGRSGAAATARMRGRPAGIRAALPRGGLRLNLVETLRAAAPWQRLRPAHPETSPARIRVRRDDLRVTRLKQRTETVTIFAVDASGSLALSRLAEAKGAVELMLAECYIRRDQVALIAFRGRSADVLLPPTRSLARAKRCLAELPGGGATPLAAAIDVAMDLAASLRRRGQRPIVVLLTDGRANMARDGTTGRAKADEDARLAARAAAVTGVRILLVDASPRPQGTAQALAAAMNALYLPLPRADASSLSRAVGQVIAA